MAGAAAAGQAINIYGSYKQSEAEADVMMANADAYEEEANELWRRANINAKATRREGGEVIAQQTAGFIMGGVEIDSGSPLDVMADTNEKVARQIGYDLETAAMQRTALEKKAANERYAAKQTMRAAKIKAVGGVAMGATAFGG